MLESVNLFKALADETRLRILSLLLSEGELCVCDIIATLKLPQSTVSRHLAYLRKTGWVSDRRCGPWMYYSIAKQEDTMFQDMVAVLRRNLVSSPVLRSDRECLGALGQDNRCA